MSVTRIPIDGLWRCLCPSIDLLPIRTPIRVRGLRTRHNRAREFHVDAVKRWPGESAVVRKVELDFTGHGHIRGEKHRESVRRINEEGTEKTDGDTRHSFLRISPTSSDKDSSDKGEAHTVKKLLKPIETFSKKSPIPARKNGPIPLSKKEIDRAARTPQKTIPNFAGTTKIPARGSRGGDSRKSPDSGGDASLGEEALVSYQPNPFRETVPWAPLKKAPKAKIPQPTSTFSSQSAIPPRRKPGSNPSSQHQTGASEQPSTFKDRGLTDNASVPNSAYFWEDVDTENDREKKPRERRPRVKSDDVSSMLAIQALGLNSPASTFPSPSSHLPEHSYSPQSVDSKIHDTGSPGEKLADPHSNPSTDNQADINSALHTSADTASTSQWTKIPARKGAPITNPNNVEEDDRAVQIPREHPTSSQSDPSTVSFVPLSSYLEDDQAAEIEDPSRQIEFAFPPKSHPEFDGVDLSLLHHKLQSLTKTKDSYVQIGELVTYLIRNRGEQPSLVHYDALIRANADADLGSADVVRFLLQEMKDLGIGADSGLYHGVLQVLTIHPDYLLREQVLTNMKIRWFGLSPEGWHNYVVGLIRERQYEVAMDKLEQMHSDNITVQPWLYDIFMFQLCDARELDEVFKLLKHRWDDSSHEIHPSIWYYMLDSFTKAFHYQGTKFIWQKRVQTDKITPSDGICTAALNLAARYADPGLATSVVRILSSRFPVLPSYHYEALLAAYAGAGDMNTAFRILAIMSKAQMEPDKNTTRPIFIYLSQSTDLLRMAWNELKSLSENGHTIPVAAANVILEAYCEMSEFVEAVALYKELHEFIYTGPDVETFSTLLQGAVAQPRKDLTMFLASEMAYLDVKPNQLTYDLLIRACLKEDDYEDAFKYLEEMVEIGATKGDGGWWMQPFTAEYMVRRCALNRDERAWTIFESMESRGMDVNSNWVDDNWGASKDSLSRWLSEQT